MAPFLTEKINDALYASESDCYGLVNELAEQLRQLETENRLPTYKAMLEEAPGDLSLEEALDLVSIRFVSAPRMQPGCIRSGCPRPSLWQTPHRQRR